MLPTSAAWDHRNSHVVLTELRLCQFESGVDGPNCPSAGPACFARASGSEFPESFGHLLIPLVGLTRVTAASPSVLCTIPRSAKCQNDSM